MSLFLPSGLPSRPPLPLHLARQPQWLPKPRQTGCGGQKTFQDRQEADERPGGTPLASVHLAKLQRPQKKKTLESTNLREETRNWKGTAPRIVRGEPGFTDFSKWLDRELQGHHLRHRSPDLSGSSGG